MPISYNFNLIAEFISGFLSFEEFIHTFNFSQYFNLGISIFLSFFIIANLNDFDDSESIKEILFATIKNGLFALFTGFIFPYFFIAWCVIICTPVFLITGDAVLGCGSIFCLIIDVIILILTGIFSWWIVSVDNENDETNKHWEVDCSYQVPKED